MKLCLFREGVFADFRPMLLNGVFVEFGNLTYGKVNGLNAFCIRLMCFEKCFRQNRLGCLEFAHMGFTARLIKSLLFNLICRLT